MKAAALIAPRRTGKLAALLAEFRAAAQQLPTPAQLAAAQATVMPLPPIG